MKKTIIFFAILFSIVSCKPQHDYKIPVTVHFYDETSPDAQVTFTSEQGHGSFTFSKSEGAQVTKNIPNVGTWQICIVNNAGCVTYFQATQSGQTNYNIHPCATGRTLENDYAMFTQCE